MRRRLALVLALLVSSFPVFAPAEEESRIARIETGLLPSILIKDGPRWSIQERLDKYRVPGVSVAVIFDYKIDWAAAYGITDIETEEPVMEKTLFQAASISKPVAAMAALKAVQDGKISLYENINNKLVSWKLPDNEFTEKNNVTLKHLLSHSAGTTVHGFRGYAADEAVPSVIEVLNGEKPANSIPIRVDFEPGRRYRYSGGGFTVMQQALVDIEKKPFPQILRETIMDPLEMTDSSYEQPLPPERLRFAAAGHRTPGDLVAGKRHTYPEMAAAGLWTTPSDLARFAIEIQLSLKGQSNRVLSKELTQEMITPFVSKNYALGLQINSAGYFSHGGSNEGFKCVMIAHREKGYGAVVMTNGDLGSSLCSEILRSIAREYEWENYLPVEHEAIKLEPKEQEAYTGRFLRYSDDVVTFLHKQDRLFLSDYRTIKNELYPIDKDTFADLENAVYIRFERDESGIIDRLVYLNTAGRTLQKRRKVGDDYIAPIDWVTKGEYNLALEAYQNLLKDFPRDFSLRENSLNSKGYELLNEGMHDEAICLFRINTKLYPKSANTYDSLGDAYSAKGEIELAVESYKSALEAIPNDTSQNKANLLQLKSDTEEKLRKLEKKK